MYVFDILEASWKMSGSETGEQMISACSLPVMNIVRNEIPGPEHVDASVRNVRY